MATNNRENAICCGYMSLGLVVSTLAACSINQEHLPRWLALPCVVCIPPWYGTWPCLRSSARLAARTSCQFMAVVAPFRCGIRWPRQVNSVIGWFLNKHGAIEAVFGESLPKLVYSFSIPYGRPNAEDLYKIESATPGCY